MDTGTQPEGERPACAKAQLSRYVDHQINRAAIIESVNATSATQEPGADLGEGSAYLDNTTIALTALSAACNICLDTVELSTSGSIDAPKCLISGSCEIEWATRYPEQYSAENTASRLVCDVEVDCLALIALHQTNGKLGLTLEAGVCEVAARGDNWRKRCALEINSMECTPPEQGIEEFDGEGSGREQ